VAFIDSFSAINGTLLDVAVLVVLVLLIVCRSPSCGSSRC
jgi:hypothetical protein